MKIFKEKFHPKIKSDLKKLDKGVVVSIREKHLDTILKDPYKNNKLKGSLSLLYSYHFKENATEYRIAYEIIDNEILFYLMIAKRENFYKKIKTRK